MAIEKKNKEERGDLGFGFGLTTMQNHDLPAAEANQAVPPPTALTCRKPKGSM